MALGVAARLRPDGETMWFGADRNFGDRTGPGIHHIDFVVKTPRQPELRPIGADIAHVGATSSRDWPLRHYRTGSEIDHRYAPRRLRFRPRHTTRTPIGYVEL